jgi:hypothetical protein
MTWGFSTTFLCGAAAYGLSLAVALTMTTKLASSKAAQVAPVVLLLGCSQPDSADLQPTNEPPRPLVATSSATVTFGDGWHPIETGPEGTWRWMGSHGELDVALEGSPMDRRHMRIEGWAPVLENMLGPPWLTIVVDGRTIDQFLPAPGRFIKEYDLPEGGPRKLHVSIQTSIVAHPRGDPRDLGFALTSFSFRNGARAHHFRFGQGWYGPESNAEGTWRWMPEHGEIKVFGSGAAKHHVRVEGWVIELPSQPTLVFKLDGKQLDSFVAPTGRFVKEYDVTAEGETMLFTIDTSATAHPAGDSRTLGFALTHFSFDNASP